MAWWSPWWVTPSTHSKCVCKRSRLASPSTVSPTCRLSCCVAQQQLSFSTVAAGMMDCVRKTIQWEGPLGLYKVSSPAEGSAPAAVLLDAAICTWKLARPTRSTCQVRPDREGCWLQGVTSPLAGQMFFRATLCSARLAPPSAGCPPTQTAPPGPLPPQTSTRCWALTCRHAR